MTERIVHIGLGAFFKAHQAWYTQHSEDAKDWKIVAYTGRTKEAADLLNTQNCVYTLIERGPEEDVLEKISVISRAVPGTDLADLIYTLAKPEISIVTLTITEAGYQVDPTLPLEKSALGRLAMAIENRRRAGALPIAIVPCDNMPNNGQVAKSALLALGAKISDAFCNYLESSVSFVSTSVDRITPKTTKLDIAKLKEKGVDDNSPVVTEPFRDWVLSGEFPAGRPAWETAGAKFVSEIEPFENRKLWLLNGAHSILALLGRLLGHSTVAQATADPICKAELLNWWNTVQNQLANPELEIASYREALISRFENPRIEHFLSQISNESSLKLGVRIAPIALYEYQHARTPKAAITAFAAWYLNCSSRQIQIDNNQKQIEAALAKTEPVKALIAVASKELSENSDFVHSVELAIESLRELSNSHSTNQNAVLLTN